MSPISTPSGIARSAVQLSSAASPTAGCSARVAFVLAGRGATTRTVALSTALGLPVAALPINSERNLVECWVKRMAEGGFRGHVVLAITSESERAFYSALQAPPGITLQVQVDTSGHRGAGGTLGDRWNELVDSLDAQGRAGGAIVVEASNVPIFDFGAFFAAVDPSQGAFIGASADATPAGIMWLSPDALGLVPRIGYFDLKEQLVTAIVRSGKRVGAHFGPTESCRISDRVSYLRAVSLIQADGAEGRCDDAVVESGAVVRGASLLCRGAVVERGALVVDSIILPGARVCCDAVVARSIVPPGSHVPCGYLVVDEIFGALGSAARSGTEGGAS
jgi:hypothetical protein